MTRKPTAGGAAKGAANDPCALSEAALATLETMQATTIAACDAMLDGVRKAMAAHPDLATHTAISEHVAYLAGQIAARAEFIAFNCGGQPKDVKALCGGAFNDGRADAYAQQESAGFGKRPTAASTGAVQ